MSTLVMVLTAALVVPGSGPEKVAWEMEQRLDLRGEWVIMFLPDYSEITLSGERFLRSYQVHDEGCGQLRMNYHHLWADSASTPCKGIYRQDGDRVLICLRKDDDLPPTRFQSGVGQEFLILHRVKPRK